MRIGCRRRPGSLLWLVLVLPLVPLVSACSERSGTDERHDRPPNVLLITVDALRAANLGCYGYRLDTSPHIDAFAARGVRFVDATVQWPKTWPSIASLLTGAYPRTTGMRIKRRVLPESLTVLSEVLGAAGYDTGAVVSNFNIGTTWGFDQGFDHFVESWTERWHEAAGDRPFVNRAGLVKEYTNATLVTDQGLRWLDTRDGVRPFFLWLHYMDPHGPYVPPEAYRDLYADAYPSRAIPLEQLPTYQRQSDESGLITDLGFYRAQYDREIRYLDDEIGRLMSALAGRGLDTGTVYAFTADHGESLGEHDYYLEHGKLSYQPTAAVPLIIAQPGRIVGGRVIDVPVGVIDVAATIVELAALPVPPSFEGTSLAGLLRAAEGAQSPALVFMESGYDGQLPQLTVREGRWKLIRVASRKDQRAMSGSHYELYDLVADPGEITNLAEQEREVTQRLTAALEAWYTNRPQPVPAAEEIDPESLDPRSRDMLRALGYLGSDQ